MPNTFTQIASVTVGVLGAATIDFTSIPSSYTDLCLKISARSSLTVAAGGYYFVIKPNGSTTSQSYKALFANGSTANSSSGTTLFGDLNPSDYTSNTFNNGEIYIPNYAGSNNKSMSIDTVTENNATTVNSGLYAGLWSNTAAITSINLSLAAGTFVQYSTATLYGISKS